MNSASTFSKCRRPKISRWSRHSRRAEPTQRSANAFATGLRKGRWMTYTPSLFKTSSKAPLNFESRSRTVLQLPGQIPRLLHHPLAGGMGGHPGEVNAAAADLNEEEDVEQAQPDRVHGEEVAGQDLVGVLVDELAPGALAAARRREHAVAAQHPLHGLVRATVAELEQLALDST